jgi:SAM-dependent methyltransferase
MSGSLESMRAYYNLRADEYDEWYLGTGRFADYERPEWDTELDGLIEMLAGLEGRRTLDAACGTGFLTRHLRGYVVGVDQSPSMVAIAQRRLPHGLAVIGDALELPFADAAFERMVAGHFYGHLTTGERARFLAEAARLASEIVVVDSALRDGVEAEEYQERVLNDGSRHRVYKRYLTPARLLDELGGGDTLFDGRFFVAVRSRLG